jgi:hypothetical protein
MNILRKDYAAFNSLPRQAAPGRNLTLLSARCERVQAA